MRAAAGRQLVAAAAVLTASLIAACSSASTPNQPATPAPSSRASTFDTTPSARQTSQRAVPTQTRTSSRTVRPAKNANTAATSRASIPDRPRPAALPLQFRTGTATQVITVTARSTASTRGTLQAWRKIDGGWRRVGPSLPAWLGSDGITRHASETKNSTPIGSFTLTRAFGRQADPGTALPYTRTTTADWWVSEPGPLYNTMQRCASSCGFTTGNPNEHLFYTVPFYRYAVVIDYNTRNSPTGVVQGAGSAFFLHVSVGEPTQGCISIDEGQLIRLLRWLSPAHHPRILIGVGG